MSPKAAYVVRRECPEGGRCETDDERNTREYGWYLPPGQDDWLCWKCAEPVAPSAPRSTDV